MVVSGTPSIITKWLPILFIISALAGIGRGGGSFAGSQAGPFAPAEQALMADLVPSHRRITVFALNAFVASILAAAGSLLSGLPSWLRVFKLDLPIGGDNLLFLMTIVIAALSVPILLTVPESIRR